jgi:hypothetical protein
MPQRLLDSELTFWGFQGEVNLPLVLPTSVGVVSSACALSHAIEILGPGYGNSYYGLLRKLNCTNFSRTTAEIELSVNFAARRLLC